MNKVWKSAVFIKVVTESRVFLSYSVYKICSVTRKIIKGVMLCISNIISIVNIVSAKYRTQAFCCRTSMGPVGEIAIGDALFFTNSIRQVEL